jgi:hypothetical protein
LESSSSNDSTGRGVLAGARISALVLRIGPQVGAARGSGASSKFDTLCLVNTETASAPLPTLTLRFPSRRALLSASRANGPQLTLFAPTTAPPPMGMELRLDISCADTPGNFELVGKVIFVRERSRGPGQQPGVGIAFVEQEKRRAAEMLARCAGKPGALGTSSSQRVPVDVKCVVRAGGRKYPAHLRDLSSSGAFVCLPAVKPLREGTVLEIQIEPAFLGFGGTRVNAKVIWSGRKAGLAGFGARFISDPALVRPSLRRYLDPR